MRARTASSGRLVMAWRVASCGCSLEGSFKASAKGSPTGWLPPLHKGTPRFLRTMILVTTQRGKRRPIDAPAILTSPATEPVRRGGVIGEGSERFLKRLECVEAGRPRRCRKRDGENLEGIPEFFSGDAKPVNLVGRDKLPIGSLEKPLEQHGKSVVGVDEERLSRNPCRDGGQKPLDAAWPVVGDERLANFPDGFTRHVSPLGEHRSQPHASPGCQRQRMLLVFGRLPGQFVSQNIEIPSGPRCMADFSQSFLEPISVLLRHEVVKGREGRERSPSRYTKLMHPLGVMTLATGSPKLGPHRFEPLAKGARGHPRDRNLPAFLDGPGHRPLHGMPRRGCVLNPP